MNADEGVEVAPRRAEFERETEDVNEFAGFVADHRRADHPIACRVDDEPIETQFEIPLRATCHVCELQRHRARRDALVLRLFLGQAGARELRLRERRVRQHAIVTLARLPREGRLQAPKIFPRHVRECRLTRDVAERVDAGTGRLQELVDFDEAALQFDSRRRGIQIGRVRRPPGGD